MGISNNIKIELSKCKNLEFELKLTNKSNGNIEKKLLMLNIEDTKRFYKLKTNGERENFLRNINCVRDQCYILKR